ncbi:hypothetical protein KFL_007630020 [Klebsormidium nitens]|uniref:Reverse transcriptase Ty1/copia-type domain-containing protein n=1 Tax=Klebsormidium nitens TaxID=105231 RepID=A0A1Y1IQ07_KLENI|nr:hypothetical protein KFL_007630020 [Klebsormidium nitens]|eukprot:GAQ91311.1 hypothetical protein KFL_007630020 [Klebsormidium nitens]
MDVKIAFLNGELEEEIYMQQPQGYEQGGLNVVCHLKRTLYGLRQAPRARHTRLKEELGNFEIVASLTDTALFLGVVDGERAYLIVWVDDILVAARGAERIAKVKAHLAEKFNVRDLGEATYFLGMEVARDREARTLKLTQKKLAGELFGWHGLAGARARSVLLGAGEKSIEAHRRDSSLCAGAGARKEVQFAYCKTEDMKADIFTKALAPGKFLKCKKEIGVA